ncbi:MAG TPA: ABC transporter substrate-binding protein [Gemmatimonadales bacterium]|nr:ABC transporter substrate-binding protein [Gemmatimonadales bacterium]
MRHSRRFAALAVVVSGAWLSCAPHPPGCRGEYCGTVVFAAIGEPETLLPPLVESAVARDISDQIFLKLADLGPETNTIGDEGFTPALAERWVWNGKQRLVFHLNTRARWQDGRPVTAGDVAFTFAAYNDPVVNSPARAAIHWITSVTAVDSATVVFQFAKRYPEMFYDAVYHMRILPAHLLQSIPRSQWASAQFGRSPVGDGPYRFVSWTPTQSVELAADSTFFLGRPHLRRLIWRVTPDMQVAVTALVAGEDDAIEVLVSPDNVRRVADAHQLATYPYKGSAYGYLGFNLRARGDSTKPHPLFSDRELRRALAMAVDRDRLLQSVFETYAKVPPGPMSEIWSIWDVGTRQLSYDTTRAARMLTKRGWTDSDSDGVRDRNGMALSFSLLVPTSSALRRRYARLLQDEFRRIGVEVRIDEVEFGVFTQRAKSGQFDAILQTWNTDPTPSSAIVQTWTRAGVGQSNYLHYVNPAFDRAVDQARSVFNFPLARRQWRAALDMLNQDAPAVFLFATTNVAAVHGRIENVTIHPDSWWATVRTWRIPADRLIQRDSVGS